MYGRNAESLMGLYVAAAAFEQERARNLGVRQLAEFRASATPGAQWYATRQPAHLHPLRDIQSLSHLCRYLPWLNNDGNACLLPSQACKESNADLRNKQKKRGRVKEEPEFLHNGERTCTHHVAASTSLASEPSPENNTALLIVYSPRIAQAGQV